MKKKKKQVKQSSLEEEILSLFETKKKPLLLRELYHLLNIPKPERQAFREFVQKLCREGKLVQIRKRKFGLPSQFSAKKGKIRVHPDGFAFVETEDGQTVFIPPRKVGKALDGDTVLVQIEKIAKKGPEGRVLSVIERKRKYIVGYLVKRNKFFFLEPEDPRIPVELYIPKKRKGKALPNHLVVAKIIQSSSEFGVPMGEVLKDLGDPEDINTHVWAVIYGQDLPFELPHQAKKELMKLPDEVREEDKVGRVDLRELPFVTIDGENARDFDDAICVTETPKGFKLYVAIADVSHYVPMNSFLDKDAYLRGTSVYFPTMVIPMFPEKLSNHLCSLKPYVDRLVMVVEIDYTKNGMVKGKKFYEGVIRSKARLTYTEVKRMLIDGDKEVIEKYKELYPMLNSALELSQLIRAQRTNKGSLDFDLPEPEVLINLEGKIENIIKRERNPAHMLIEDFMIAANVAVAEFLTDLDYPFLYRVHEEPDPNKLRELSEIFLSLGYSIDIPEKVTPSFIQELLKQFEGKPTEHLFNHLVLRSLKQARYSPENVGHFGLAETHYCHFTSPIRRYPDLVVHRVLKRALRKKKPPYSHEELLVMGKHLSERERKAEEAERDVVKRLQAFFMQDKVGQEFYGIISGVSAFGFFVDLEDYMVSGVVRVIDLVDDVYILDEKGISLIGKNTGKVYQIGQRIKVKLKKVDLRRFYIDFVPVEE
ncbi:MAG: ribonuclease R [Thermodesulfobacteriaceae bacterium]|jgi:ribonuclease R